MEFSQETRERAIRMGLETLTRPEGGFFLPIRRDALAALVDAAQGHPTDAEAEAMWVLELAERGLAWSDQALCEVKHSNPPKTATYESYVSKVKPSSCERIGL